MLDKPTIVRKPYQGPGSPGWLRICHGPGCYAPAPWTDNDSGDPYCGPCIAILAVNRFIAAGRIAELGITAPPHKTIK